MEILTSGESKYTRIEGTGGILVRGWPDESVYLQLCANQEKVVTERRGRVVYL